MLQEYKDFFDNAYQETFRRTLSGLEIANLRFQKYLTYGQSITRVAYDTSGVMVRDVVHGNAAVIDTIKDTSEQLFVNIDREAWFYISDREVKQAGPLNPGTKIGQDIGHKVASNLDGLIFKETINAENDFDAGDLTSLTSNGTPITMNATTVPQMVTRMPAKLNTFGPKTLSNLVFVGDYYMIADLTQYLLGKNYNIVDALFKNGRTEGDFASAKVYTSENLYAEVDLLMGTNPTAGDTFTLRGVKFQYVSSIGTTPGNILIGSTVDATRANTVLAINNPKTTDSKHVGYNPTDAGEIRVLESYDMANVRAVNNSTAGAIEIGGNGRFITSHTLTASSDKFANNIVHAYYGKKGAIDVVVQTLNDCKMRPCDDRSGTNVSSTYLAGIKTFADGKVKFLDVLIKGD